MLTPLKQAEAITGQSDTVTVSRQALRCSSGQIGNDIRALRKSRDWTLAMLANRLNRSIGWLSQVERGSSEPSLSDIRQIAAVFQLPVSFFFSDQPETAESDIVVRADTRRKMRDDDTGMVEELLSPDLGGAFEIVRSVFPPGSRLTQTVQRQTEEAGYVVTGALELTLDDRRFVLAAGDSFRFAGETMAWANPGTEDTVVIWVIAPPVY